MFNLMSIGKKDRYTQTFLGDETTGRLTWGNWAVGITIVAVHTLLIIAVILYVCGSHDNSGPLAGTGSPSIDSPKTENLIQGNHGHKQISSIKTAIKAMVKASPTTIVDAATTTTTSTTTTTTPTPPTTTIKTTTTTPALEEYLENRSKVKTKFNEKFVEASEKICGDDEEPFLVIICVTKHYQKMKRAMIRRTWGWVAKSGRWPRENRKFPGIKLIFLLGHPPGHASKQDTAIADEEKQFGDLVQADFIDSPQNASMKILLGFQWVNTFCPQTKFVLRVSDDNFVHVANLVKYLETIKVPEKGVVLGRGVKAKKVQRKGRWAVDKNVFPYDEYPEFANKNSYVTSGNAVAEIASAAPFLPYVFIEDAFVTGILRSSAGADLISHDGFMKGAEPRPKLCGFHNTFRFTSSSNPSLTVNLWKSLKQDIPNCYTLPEESDLLFNN